MSFLKKRGEKWYLYEKVRVPNPSFDPSLPSNPKTNRRHIWKQRAVPISDKWETVKDFRRDYDYDKERRDLHLPNRRLSWADFVERLKLEVFPAKKPGTAERDGVALRSFERVIKPTRITDATADAMSLFRVKRIEDGVSQSTVNIEIGCLKAAFTKAVEWGYLREHPGRFIKKYTIPEKSRHALTRKETARAIEAAKKSESPDVYGMLMFFLLTGVRLQELTHLLWDRVDLKGGTFTIEAWDSAALKDWPAGWRRVRWSPKNSQIRTNPLDDALLPILRRRLAERETPLVFPGLAGPRQRFRLGELFGRLFKRAGIDSVTIHNLRHTYATRMVESGCDLPTLSRLMGHSGPQVTMVYFTSEVGHKREQQRKLKVV